MATQVTIDRLEDLGLTERHGILMSLRKRAFIRGLVTTDHNVLFEALNNLGLAPGSVLEDGDGAQTGLVLTERNATILPDDNSAAFVDLFYEHFMNEGQVIDKDLNPYGGALIESRASLQQITTQWSSPWKTQSEATAAGGTVREQLFVEHEFPADDPDFPSQLKVQGGEIQVFEQQETIQVSGIKFTTDIFSFVNSILNHVNSVPWLGRAVRTWLCTNADYTWLSRTAPEAAADLAQLMLVFQYKETTWDPDALFIDERNGKPPKDLVEDVGFKTVQYQPSADFGTILGLLG